MDLTDSKKQLKPDGVRNISCYHFAVGWKTQASINISRIT